MFVLQLLYVVTGIDRYSSTIVVTCSNICRTVLLACGVTLIIEDIEIVLSEYS